MNILVRLEVLIGDVVFGDSIWIIVVIKHRMSILSQALEHIYYGTYMLLIDVIICSQTIEIRILNQIVVKEEFFGQIFESCIDRRLVNLVQV